MRAGVKKDVNGLKHQQKSTSCDPRFLVLQDCISEREGKRQGGGSQIYWCIHTN